MENIEKKGKQQDSRLRPRISTDARTATLMNKWDTAHPLAK